MKVEGLDVVKPNCKEIRRRVAIVFQDPDDQLFMPTVRDDVAFGPANLGLRGEELKLRVKKALAAVGMEDVGEDRPTTSASASAGGWRWRPCWPWSPTSSSSTSRRPTSTLRPAAS